MRVVQFVIPALVQSGVRFSGRRVGYVDGDVVVDVTSVAESLKSVFDVFEASQESGKSFDETLLAAGSSGSGGSVSRLDYAELLGAEVGGSSPYLIVPFDHPDDHRLLVSGTGLTHTGSAKSRDEMHSDDGADAASDEIPAEPATDSAKMFQMGIDGGKPEPGDRGTEKNEIKNITKNKTYSMKPFSEIIFKIIAAGGIFKYKP